MKIIGTGTIHHLPKGSEHEVTEEIGHILVKSGRATLKNEVLIGSKLVEIKLIDSTTGEATIIPLEDNSIEGSVKDEAGEKAKDAVKEDKKPKAKKK